MIKILALFLHILFFHQAISVTVGTTEPICGKAIVDRKRILDVINAIPVSTDQQVLRQGKLVTVRVPPPERHYFTPAIFRAANGSAQVYVTILESRRVSPNPVTMTKYVWPYARKMAKDIYDFCQTEKWARSGQKKMNVFFPNEQEGGALVLLVRLEPTPPPMTTWPNAVSIFQVPDKIKGKPQPLQVIHTSAVLGGTNTERPLGATRDPKDLPSPSCWSKLTGGAKTCATRLVTPDRLPPTTRWGKFTAGAKKSLARLVPDKMPGAANEAKNPKTRFQSHQIIEPEVPGPLTRPTPEGIAGPPLDSGGPRTRPSLMTKVSGGARRAMAKAASLGTTKKEFRPADAPILSATVKPYNLKPKDAESDSQSRSALAGAAGSTVLASDGTVQTEETEVGMPPSNAPSTSTPGIVPIPPENIGSSPQSSARAVSGVLPNPGGTIGNRATRSYKKSPSRKSWVKGPEYNPDAAPVDGAQATSGGPQQGTGRSGSPEIRPAENPAGNVQPPSYRTRYRQPTTDQPPRQSAADAGMPSGGLGGPPPTSESPATAQRLVGANVVAGQSGGDLQASSSMPEMNSVPGPSVPEPSVPGPTVPEPPAKFRALSVKTNPNPASSLPGIAETSAEGAPLVYDTDQELAGAENLPSGEAVSPYRPRRITLMDVDHISTL